VAPHHYPRHQKERQHCHYRRRPGESRFHSSQNKRKQDSQNIERVLRICRLSCRCLHPPLRAITSHEQIPQTDFKIMHIVCETMADWQDAKTSIGDYAGNRQGLDSVDGRNGQCDVNRRCYWDRQWRTLRLVCSQSTTHAYRDECRRDSFG